MNVLDLFSGIGSFSLGLERAGMRTVAFCEENEYCRAILHRHWNGVPVYVDVRELSAARLLADGIVPEVICGGFPCQDISDAGKRVGLGGARSGLWHEYARIIEETRPAWVIIENVSALRNRGLETVLGQISALGYDAEWHCIPAYAVGAPHKRDRIWIVAHAHDKGQAHPCEGDARGECLPWRDAAASGRDEMGEPPRPLLTALTKSSWWDTEPAVGRVADGTSNRVDRLRALGNTLVPQIAEIIGKAIMQQQARSKP